MSFSKALTVFDDSLAKIFYDIDNSEIETLEIIIGHSSTGTLLLVSFTERQSDRVRIISAREVTRLQDPLGEAVPPF